MKINETNLSSIKKATLEDVSKEINELNCMDKEKSQIEIDFKGRKKIEIAENFIVAVNKIEFAKIGDDVVSADDEVLKKLLSDSAIATYHSLVEKETAKQQAPEKSKKKEEDKVEGAVTEKKEEKSTKAKKEKKVVEKVPLKKANGRILDLKGSIVEVIRKNGPMTSKEIGLALDLNYAPTTAPKQMVEAGLLKKVETKFYLPS